MPKAPPTVRLLLLTAFLSTPAAASFTTFESGQVRPMALSPDGTRLFAVNTPDDRLEIFSVGTGGLTHTSSVPVGLEPVAVVVESPSTESDFATSTRFSSRIRTATTRVGCPHS